MKNSLVWNHTELFKPINMVSGENREELRLALNLIAQVDGLLQSIQAKKENSIEREAVRVFFLTLRMLGLFGNHEVIAGLTPSLITEKIINSCQNPSIVWESLLLIREAVDKDFDSGFIADEKYKVVHKDEQE